MKDYVVNLVVFGVLSWTTAFLMMRMIFPRCSFDFCNRIISTIHAILAVILCSLSVQDWRCPVCPLASKSSPHQMQTLAVTLAYLIYDLICCLFDKKVKLDNLIHHLVSIVGIGAGLAYEMISFAVIFTFARMIGGPYLSYVTLSANNPFLIKAMALGLQLVSGFWFYRIARMVKYKLTRRTTSSKKLSQPTELNAKQNWN